MKHIFTFSIPDIEKHHRIYHIHSLFHIHQYRQYLWSEWKRDCLQIMKIPISICLACDKRPRYLPNFKITEIILKISTISSELNPVVSNAFWNEIFERFSVMSTFHLQWRSLPLCNNNLLCLYQLFDPVWAADIYRYFVEVSRILKIDAQKIRKVSSAIVQRAYIVILTQKMNICSGQ